MLYQVYVRGELFHTFLTEEAARDFCIRAASNYVELSKKDYYYPILREKYGVERIRDIPAEIRYKYWADEKKKCLRNDYRIKRIDTTPTKEEFEAFHKRVEEYREAEKKKKKKKIK
ncbi:hypothetical protein [Mediterraneibacter faecis]|uniref:hypothetical protein n=1 Tax=Mediterraneibacter faecis TaxID=592978 RepID=UPI0022DF3BD1|nr:hypothetical protein [Mediterraneibacter faecis]